MSAEDRSISEEVIRPKIRSALGSRTIGWVKKMGLAAFLFFLIKGIIWLLIFFGVFKYII